MEADILRPRAGRLTRWLGPLEKPSGSCMCVPHSAREGGSSLIDPEEVSI